MQGFHQEAAGAVRGFHLCEPAGQAGLPPPAGRLGGSVLRHVAAEAGHPEDVCRHGQAVRGDNIVVNFVIVAEDGLTILRQND